MAVLDLEANSTLWENGTGKLFIATDYDGAVFDKWNGTNEDTIVSSIEANYSFADVWFFENMELSYALWDERIITTDYCGVWEISRKQDKIAWFWVDIQEILEMENFALILGETLATSGTAPNEVETIVMKRTKETKPYHLFKFVSCPKNGKYNVYYFVKTNLSSDFNVPLVNLQQNDASYPRLEFAVAESGNHIIRKWLEVSES